MKRLWLSLFLTTVIGLGVGCLDELRSKRPHRTRKMTYAERICYKRGYDPDTQAFKDCVYKKEKKQQRAFERRRRLEKERRAEEHRRIELLKKKRKYYKRQQGSGN